MDFPDDLMHLIRTDEPLGPLAWLGIGGPARFFAEPMDAADVQRLIAAAQQQGLSVRILGGGSNILVREAGVDGLVISLAGTMSSEITIDGAKMTVGAGAKLSHAVIKSVGAGLGGLEHSRRNSRHGGRCGGRERLCRWTRYWFGCEFGHGCRKGCQH